MFRSKPYSFRQLLDQEATKCKNDSEGSLFPGYRNSWTQEYLLKWSMKHGFNLQSFSFDTPFKDYLLQEFVHDFFADSSVIWNLLVQNSERAFAPIGICSEAIEMKCVPCTLTSMSFFDRLFENQTVARSNGSIVACFDEYYTPTLYGGDGSNNAITGETMHISNELQKMILVKESKKPALYSESEQDEFLFRIFQHLVIGGMLCQYEDFLTPYLKVTKTLYKDLVGVSQVQGIEDGKNESIRTTSIVVQVLSARSDTYSPKTNLLFHKAEWNNFFYLVINPLQRIVNTIYHHV